MVWSRHSLLDVATRLLAYTTKRVIVLPLYMCSIQALLSAPNPDDPLAENVAKHWKENEQEAVATGKGSVDFYKSKSSW